MAGRFIKIKMPTWQPCFEHVYMEVAPSALSGGQYKIDPFFPPKSMCAHSPSFPLPFFPSPLLPCPYDCFPLPTRPPLS